MDAQEYPAHAIFTVHGCLSFGLETRLPLATLTRLHTHWLRFMLCFAASWSIQSKVSVGILIPDDLVGFGISASFGVCLCIGFTAGKLEAVSVHALCNKALLDCSASARERLWTLVYKCPQPFTGESGRQLEFIRKRIHAIQGMLNHFQISQRR